MWPLAAKGASFSAASAKPALPGGGVSAHHQQFRDEAVERFAVAQGVEEEPAEGARAVQRGIDERRILGEEVEPIAHQVIDPAFVGQQAVDDPGAFVGRGVGEKGAHVVGSGRQADGVEKHAAEEGRVAGDRGLCQRFGCSRRGRPLGAAANPGIEGGDLRLSQRIACRGHDEVFLAGADADHQLAGLRIARHDGGDLRVAAAQGRVARVEFQAALVFLAMAAETRLPEHGQDIAVEIRALLRAFRGGGAGGERGRDLRVDKGVHGMAVAGRRGSGMPRGPVFRQGVALFPEGVARLCRGAPAGVVEGVE